MNGLFFLVDSLMTYTEKNPIWLFYAAALLYILFAGGKDGRRIWIYPLVLQGLTIFNPLFVKLLVEKFGFAERYLRFFWMLAFYLTIAYAIVSLAFRFRKRLYSTAILICGAALIFYLGVPVFWSEQAPDYEMTENAQFTSDEILRLSQILHSENIEVPHVLYDLYFLTHYRSYDPSVTSEMTRDIALDLTELSLDEMKAKEWGTEDDRLLYQMFFYGDISIPTEEFLRIIKERNIDYIVCGINSPQDTFAESAGLIPVGRTQHYQVWKPAEK